MEWKQPEILEIRKPEFDFERITEQQQAALELFRSALVALADAGLYLHANEETLYVDDSHYGLSPWDTVAHLSKYVYQNFYNYHLSEEQEGLKNTIAGLKKLLGKDDD